MVRHAKTFDLLEWGHGLPKCLEIFNQGGDAWTSNSACKTMNKFCNDNLEGNDPGAPKNPNIMKKFLFTTLLTTVIFIGIYYIVTNGYFNLREFIK